MAKKTIASSKNLGLLASISLTRKMADAVKDGYGDGHHSARDKAARGQNLTAARKALLDDGCEVIATIGGLFVNTGISGIPNSTTPFVSMTGSIPASPDS